MEHSVLRGRLGALLKLLVMAPLFALVFLLQTQIDEHYGDYRASEDVLYVQDGGLLKKALVGFDTIAADLYWLRAVQYFGAQRRDPEGSTYALLEPLLRLTVTLNPDLFIAYTYGATFLSEAYPGGAGQPLKGIELIDLGIDKHPDRWRFYLDKGFIYYWYLEDYQKAAEVFRKGSELPEAPFWMLATAGRAMTSGGERATARGLWQILFETAENEQIRNNALMHLMQLDALDQMDRLDEIAMSYKDQQGQYPRRWEDLIRAGLLDGVPRDPTGADYRLNLTIERVELSDETELGRLPSRARSR